ncbi:MAG: alpha/beta hydrolase [Bacteroidetes bacterium]|nr:alpha/beta hydrolase [Bacteroidota bacterium]
MSRLIRILIIIFSTWAIVLVAGCLLQRKMIFYPEKLPRSEKFELAAGKNREVFISTSDSQVINGIFFNADSPKGAIIYLHGNAGSLRSWQYIWNDFKDFNYDLLLIDYRGYGKSTGKISEDGLYRDGEACFQFLKSRGYDEKQTIVYGRSIGTGIAVELALRKNCRSLILETPYTSLPDLANNFYPFLLPKLFLSFRFNNLEKAPSIKCPVLILHGDFDEIIPVSHAHKLLGAFKSTKEIVIIPSGNHNNLSAFPEFQNALRKFLAP